MADKGWSRLWGSSESTLDGKGDLYAFQEGKVWGAGTGTEKH